MPAHVLRRLDPSPTQLLDLLAETYRRAARDAVHYADGLPSTDPPSFGNLLNHASELPQGVWARRYRLDWRSSPIAFGACWWTDVLGRRHWLAQAHADEQRYTIGSFAEEHGSWDGLVEGRHALEWLAPEVAGGWRARGGEWEYVVSCRCGFAGTPESLAWAGTSCGPCFDREQEGLPSAGLPPLRKDVGLLSAFHLTPAGELIGAHASSDHSLRLRVWPAPWTGKPRWGRDWSEYRRLAVSPGGLIALETTAGRVTFVGLSDGRTRDSRLLPYSSNPQHFGFAGKDGERFIASMATEAGSFLRAWAVTPEGGLGEPLYLRERRGAHHVPFAVSPRGQRLLAVTNRTVEVRDSETGDVLERLAVPPGGRVGEMLALADGSVIAATFMDDRTPPALHRWRPKPEERRPGFFDWLMTASGRASDLTRPLNGGCGKLVVSPDGRLIGSVEDGLVLRDVETLEERGRFRPALCQLLPSLAFTADGLLLALTDRGLAVWPWRELFGVAR